jgi:hypothetical protein
MNSDYEEEVFPLEKFWNDIPVGKKNAVTYPTLCAMWGCTERKVRSILHELSRWDNGDSYILIRSGKSKGFYRTNDDAEINAYRLECLAKGRSIFAPIRKCNRVLAIDKDQLALEMEELTS